MKVKDWDTGRVPENGAFQDMSRHVGIIVDTCVLGIVNMVGSDRNDR